MNILLTGASGLIGSALVPSLAARGHQVVALRRGSGPAAGTPWWDPDAGRIDLHAAGSLDAVVHLAGSSIGRRWTATVKRRAWDSRINGTRLLCEALVKLPRPPGVIVCASATGFYGSRADEWLDENSPAGTGFLAELTRAWEAPTAAVAGPGLRVVNLRFGIVLSPRGGALEKMLPVFKLGLGGRLGDGRGYWSWIEIGDAVQAIGHALETSSLQGPANAVAPYPVTNAEFTRTLGRVLGRPTLFTVPRFAVNLLFGEMGREALLSSCRVRPARLLSSGFRFRFEELEPALRHLLATPAEAKRP